MQIICIGSSAKDVFYPTEKGHIVDTPEDLESQKKFCFELGAKYQVEDRYESIGGCAANVAVGLSRLGIKTYCYTKIGKDNLGEWIVEELKREGVDKEFVEIEKDCQSDLSAIIVDKKSGEHTIFFNRDANERLEIFPEKLKKADWIFVSALNSSEFVKWEENLGKIVGVCKERGIKLALNPGQSNIKENCAKIIEAIKQSQILMLNKDEAIEIMSREKKYSAEDLNDEIFLLENLKAMGPETVTLTDGARGAWLLEGNSFLQTETIGKNPVETTGAGDAFSSGFLAAHLKGKDAEECLKWGIANSGNSLNFFGATGGLLKEEGMLEKIKEVEIKKI
ncbi:MAG: carbohydrate kinase family protein [Parcubacteria group bacterium]|jgi:sugar/nucleoside kinase (ribokinase family)